MTEAHTTGAGTKSAGAAKMETPQAIREMAEKGTAQAKQAYAKMSAATAEASSVIQNAGATATQGIKDSNAKVTELARTNSNTAADPATEILVVKSPPEFFKVSAEKPGKQLAAP